MIRRALICRKFLKEKKIATRIEAFGRILICQQRYRIARAHIVLLQALWLMQSKRIAFATSKKRIVLLQAQWRRHHHARVYKQIRHQIIEIQALIRMKLARKAFVKQKKAAIAIQKTVRRFVAVHRYSKCRRGAVLAQARSRSRQLRMRYLMQRDRIIMVQSVARQCFARKRAVLSSRALARVLGVVRLFLSRVRLRNRVRAMFDAAYDQNLTALLHLSQDFSLARYVLEENPLMEDMVLGRDSRLCIMHVRMPT